MRYVLVAALNRTRRLGRRLAAVLVLLSCSCRGRRIPVRPREAEGAEREELWRLANDNYNGYQVYQQRAGERIIPVVLLDPA